MRVQLEHPHVVGTGTVCLYAADRQYRLRVAAAEHAEARRVAIVGGAPFQAEHRRARRLPQLRGDIEPERRAALPLNHDKPVGHRLQRVIGAVRARASAGIVSRATVRVVRERHAVGTHLVPAKRLRVPPQVISIRVARSIEIQIAVNHYCAR